MTVDLAEFTEVKRDRWGRPMIIPPGGGKPVAYTRTSTMCKTLDDGGGLIKWGQRMTALGMARRPDLVALAASANGDKTILARVAADAMAAAESGAAANTGTALHAFTEQIDQGLAPVVPVEHRGALAAYIKATAPLEMVLAEQFVVCDELQTAGTFDRLARLGGQTMIADLKTGQNAAKYATATAIQIAIYAHSQIYDPATGARSDLPGPLNLDAGLLIELPAGSSTCTIHKLDLRVAWVFAQVARDVREYRKYKPATLLWAETGLAT